MNYQRTVLPNGLRVITVPMPSFESATVMVMVGAGSRYETKKNNGISHFLEHMAFKGTKNKPSAMAISSIIDGMGGECNAFTGKETTGYYIKSASTRLETDMDVLSDMLQNSLFDPAEIDKERGVIIEEINMYEDTPMRKLGDVYEALLYGDTPMGWDVAGEKDIIMSIQRKDFLDYMKSLYSAHNMTVVIAGGIDEKKSLELAEKYFGQMGRFETKKYTPVSEHQTQPQVKIKKKTTEQVHVALGVRTVALTHKDQYPLSVLAAILGGGMSSRLFHEVREKRGLAYYVRAHSEHSQDCGTLVTTAGVDAKRAPDAVKVIAQQLYQIKDSRFKIQEEELKKAKEYLKGHTVLELEDSRSVAGFYASQEILEDKIDNPEEVLAKIDAVSLEQIEDVAGKYFKPEGMNLAVIGNFEDKSAFEKLLV